MVLAEFLSLLLYGIAAWILPLNFSELDTSFFIKTSLTTCIAVLPVYIMKKIRKVLWPNDYENVIQKIHMMTNTPM